jgi:sRNA-binding carbon storage regulator CsrA
MDSRMESLDLQGGLVLGFRVGESVQCGEALIQVDLIKGNRVRLRFVAPKEMKITRTNAKNKEPRKSDSTD